MSIICTKEVQVIYLFFFSSMLCSIPLIPMVLIHLPFLFPNSLIATADILLPSSFDLSPRTNMSYCFKYIALHST